MFTFHVQAHIHVHQEPSEELRTLAALIRAQGELIVSTQAELTKKLEDVATQLEKVATESANNVQAVADLKAIIAAGPPIDPALETAINKVAAGVQKVDDLVADAPTP